MRMTSRIIVEILLRSNSKILFCQEVERLSKELAGEQARLGELTRECKELETTNISLKQLVHSTQDALFKEQNLVKSFQEQLQENKVSISIFFWFFL